MGCAQFWGVVMARIRSIHPSIHTDEAYAALSHGAWRLAVGILNECDDQGVFEWKPITLKMRILPAHNDDVAALLAELEANDIVRRFDIDGRSFGAVRNFIKYQRPKSPKYAHAIPAHLRIYVGLSAASGEIEPDDAPPIPRNGEVGPQRKEEGGRKTEPIGSEKKSPRGTRIPEGYKPDIECAVSLGIPREIALLEADRFVDWAKAAPGQKGVKVDWDAAWRNWCRKAAEERGIAPANAQDAARAPQVWAHTEEPIWKPLVAAYRSKHEGRKPPTMDGAKYGKPGEGWFFDKSWLEALKRTAA